MSFIVRYMWQFGQKITNGLINDLDELLNFTGISNVISYLAGLPDNVINHTTFTDLNILNNSYNIVAPIHQDLNNTPTMTQFLNAANTEYAITETPKGMNPFLVNGKQLAIINEINGMSAKVWITDQKQVVIAFQGTGGGDNLLLNPIDIATTLLTDDQVWGQVVSNAQKDALKFTQYVVHEAELQGFNTNNIFVTGHSLGGIEASYVAQQTGLEGVAFESTGIPSSPIAHDGSNFLNVITYGDFVGEYASDTLGDTSFVQSMPEGEKGTFNHYGNMVKLGDSADELPLRNIYNHWNKGNISNIIDSMDIIASFIKYHAPSTQAMDMGVSLSPYSYLYDFLNAAHGPVLSIANDTIGQYLDNNVHHSVLTLHNK